MSETMHQARMQRRKRRKKIRKAITIVVFSIIIIFCVQGVVSLADKNSNNGDIGYGNRPIKIQEPDKQYVGFQESITNT